MSEYLGYTNLTNASELNPQQIVILKAGASVLAKDDTKDPGDYDEMPMYMEDSLSLRATSQWEAPFAGIQEGAAQVSNMLNLGRALIEQAKESLGAAAGEGQTIAKPSVSFQTKFATFQVWKYSEPISFNISVTFFLGIKNLYNAKIEVVYPAAKLMRLVLPTETTGGTGSFSSLIQLQPPGPAMGDFVDTVFGGITTDVTTGATDEGTTTGGALAGRIQEAEAGGVYSRGVTFLIGKFLRLEGCFIQTVEPTFSNVLTEDGYPTSVTVQIGLSTLTVATANMTDSMLGLIK